ncbi:MAG: cupin protein [Conexibacter sp.]|nr:cupin protein [Conexibacter sp.]
METDEGLVPEGEGWFILSPGDAAWTAIEGGGAWLEFQAEGVPNQIGAGLHRLPAGESTGLYHVEANQEGFLVLEGKCLVIVEDEERTMNRYDYFHCPPETEHLMVGASEEPCVLFVFGNRIARARYRTNAIAARYGFSVEQDTDDSREAYGQREFTRVPAPWPGQLRA